MAANDQSSQPRDRTRNIVFLGDTGVGKSSTINLIAGSSVARTSDDFRVCTIGSACYKTTIGNEAVNLWDTRGLGEEGFFRSLFQGSPARNLTKFLRERHQKREIDLLVYCVGGSRRNETLVKNYKIFCLTTRRLAAPVAIVVTHLEGEKNMEDWWERNESGLRRLGMEFDDHACITAIPNHPRANVSKRTLHDLITRKYPWQAENDGSYFGSPVQRRQRVTPEVTRSTWRANDARFRVARLLLDTTRSEAQSSPGTWPHVDSFAVAAPSGKRKFYEFWKKHIQIWGARQSPAGDHSNSGAGHPALAPACYSSHHTAYDRTPQDSHPTMSVIGPASFSQTTRTTLPIMRGTGPSQPLRGESDSTISDLNSMFHRPVSGCSSYSELNTQPLVEDHGGNKPRYKDLTAVVKRREQYASRSGGFGDIWECDLMTEKPPRKVAVKAVRAQRIDTPNLAAQEKKLRRELNVWTTLQHENIVELLGVVSGFGLLPSMVSLWFSNGSLSSYLSNHEAMNLSERQDLLFDIASGLFYLHDQGVVHGDLHGGNILVDENGRACLTDFGLSEITQDFPGTSYLKSGVCAALRYADPDLVRQVHADGKVVYPTKRSDAYSFGGLTLYVLSGKQPYEGIKEFVLCTIILNGDRPLLPVNDERISPQHESLIKRCWSPEESTRPSVKEIMASLQVTSV